MATWQRKINKRAMDEAKAQKIFSRQPILCPWVTSQPYHSSPPKSRAIGPTEPPLAGVWVGPAASRATPGKGAPSIQQSSSQFFYFLRLMQLFPDTHPASLHTVLTLCKNDFFCAVDKLLYAKRCKLMYYKRNLAQNRRNMSGKATPKSNAAKNKGHNFTVTGKASKEDVNCTNATSEDLRNDLECPKNTCATKPSPEPAENVEDLSTIPGKSS